MILKLYNTLGRKKQIFKPINPPYVGMYSCGPTVYSYQHIGNLRCYIFSDILKRVLLYNGYNVKHVINVTDVGHLTSDADEGEDKIEKAALKEGKKASEISKYYFNIFREDLKKVNVIEPEIWSWASEHIKEQIELIKKLEEKGYTYRTSDGIYYDTNKFIDYGKLALLSKEGLKAGKRVDMGEKRNKTDFALWKFSVKPGIRQQEWNSPWGIGFPGWHIECSAMSSKYLGEQFDIHTGGEDHIPIHHTNEIAQSEAAFGKKPWVKYWLHCAFLLSKGEKVSKSKGGLYTISELLEKGYKPLDYRYFCLTAHYRSQLDFSLEKLDNAKNTYQRLKNICSEIKNDEKTNEKYLKDFQKAINDDLNIPAALAVLWKLIRDEKAQGKFYTIEKMDSVLGLDLLKKEEIEIPDEVKKLIKEREDARKKKDFKKSDELRNEIKNLGFKIDDTKEGTKVSKILE
ncbi:MAG: cysteine--tRNA ligase [Candidatus Pacearchaeota archaeon]